MAYSKEELCRIWLMNAPMDKYKARFALMDAPGGAAAAYDNFCADMRKTLGDAVYDALAETRRAGLDALTAQMESFGAYAVFPGKDEYPELLAHIQDPPRVLFVRGAIKREEIAVAIIGTRHETRYGREQTRQIARDLAFAGVTVVSGLARGIDTAAHMGALDGQGRTIAVLGCGIGMAYPAENTELADKIVAAGGAVISEYALLAPPLAYHFPHRNRIISGLAQALLVTEAREKSGSSITVGHALDQGREVFALPGAVDAPGSAIPLRVLRDGGSICTCAQDILDVMGWEYKAPAEPSMEEGEVPEDPVLRALFFEDKTFEELLAEVGGSADALSAQLTILEMYGAIESLPGRAYRYIRLSK